MTWNIRKTGVCVVFLVSSGTAIGFSCPPVIDAVWQASIVSATATISAAIVAGTEAITAANAVNLARITSALAVTTKQTSISSDKEVETDISVKKAVATAAADASTYKAMFNTIMDYNAATGQGVDPCGNLRRAQTVATAIGEANNDMREKVLREVDNAPGSFIVDSTAVGSMLAKRVSDAKAKYTEGALAGRDVDVPSFFTTANTTSGENQAKSTLLNYMYGVPYPAPNKETMASPTGKAFLEAKRSEDGFRSVSQASFKTIQSWTESRGTASNPQPSVLDAITQKVAAYSGGDNYDAWEQALASQSDRGLLVEYAKMAATELYLLHTEYQQFERIEANVAALLAMRARSKSPAMDSAAVKARDTAAMGKVK